MPYQVPPDLEQRLKAHLESGEYSSPDDLLRDALLALEERQTHHEQLRQEISARVARAGQGRSKPLDREALKVEARRRLNG